MASLEHDFHHAMVAIYDTEKGYGYYATYFKRMLDQNGGVQAAKRQLAEQEAQTKLFRLWELGDLDSPVEAHVIDEKYRPFFTDE